ncbi:hypothetical protein H2248_012201 [Termitomyces sp. 'cryptogamus']|nr:hypothetical protein H2248_012201 [Termitomyces sp. 'cryptogamus']
MKFPTFTIAAILGHAALVIPTLGAPAVQRRNLAQSLNRDRRYIVQNSEVTTATSIMTTTPSPTG